MQTRFKSATEAVCSTLIGFMVSFALTMYILPVCGLVPTIGQAWQITVVYTIASLIRSYGVRRMFRRL